MPGTRREKVEELIVREVCEILLREVKDPRIGFVTVTGAQISPDLRQARVFVSVMGTEEEQTATLKGLNSASRFIRGEFGKRVDMRVTPEFSFQFDAAIQRGVRIHELLEQVKRDDAPATEDGNDEPSESPGGGGDPASE